MFLHIFLFIRLFIKIFRIKPVNVNANIVTFLSPIDFFVQQLSHETVKGRGRY